jgi:hypothetical protein
MVRGQVFIQGKERFVCDAEYNLCVLAERYRTTSHQKQKDETKFIDIVSLIRLIAPTNGFTQIREGG